MYCKCNYTTMARLCIANEPKTGTFQMRINPKVKAELDDIFAKCGLTITDATNLFWQQTLNSHALPFAVTDGEIPVFRDVPAVPYPERIVPAKQDFEPAYVEEPEKKKAAEPEEEEDYEEYAVVN